QRGADPDLQRFIDPPAHALVTQPEIWTAAFVRKEIASERRQYAAGLNDPTPRFALEAQASWAATLMFFREMALAGFPRQGKLNVGRLESWIDDALARMQRYLQRLAVQPGPARRP